MTVTACITPLLTPAQGAVLGVFLGGVFWVPVTAAANRWRWRAYWAAVWRVRRRRMRRAGHVQPGRQTDWGSLEPRQFRVR